MRGKSTQFPAEEGWCACAAMLMPFDVQTVLYGGPRSRAWRAIDPLAIGDELSPTGICVDESLSSRRFLPVSASFNLGGRSERSLRSSYTLCAEAPPRGLRGGAMEARRIEILYASVDIACDCVCAGRRTGSRGMRGD